jgi:hypothetical protein
MFFELKSCYGSGRGAGAAVYNQPSLVVRVIVCIEIFSDDWITDVSS